MTCCVAIALADGNVCMGADSAGISGWDMTVRADSKVFFNGEFLISFTTSFRMGQLLRYTFSAPTIDGDLFNYMVTHFVDTVRDCLKRGGYARRENEVESAGSFMVGVRGRLFEINSDYQVGESQSGYAAIGCGAPYALGALYATAGQEPETRIRIALEAAERMSAGVRGPFSIEILQKADRGAIVKDEK